MEKNEQRKARLLEARRALKRRKPDFSAQDAHKKVRIKKRWRRPKGTDSKMRLNIRGYRKGISVGYRSPREVRGQSPSGLVPMMVANTGGLEMIQPDVHAAVIAASVGKKKRLDIAKAALEKGIKILNMKDISGFVKRAEEEKIKKQAEKEKSQKDREKKKEELAKKSSELEKKKARETEKEEDKSLDAIASEEEEKAKEAKKEKDRVLTRKEV